MADAIYSTRRAGAVLLAMAGMALQWAGLHAVTFSASIFPSATDAAANIWPINSLVTFLVFATAFCASGRNPEALSKPWVVPAVAALLACGFLSFALTVLLGLDLRLLGLASACMACGTTPLILLWAGLFKYLNPQNEQLLVTLGGIVCSVALYLVETLAPTFLSVPLFIVVPLGSLACFVHARAVLEDLSKSWVPAAEGGATKSPALLYLCIVAFSIPCNFLRDSPDIQTVIQSGEPWAEVLSVTIIIMLAVSLSETAAERRGVLLAPSVVLFLLLTAMLAHLLPATAGGQMTPYLLYAGYYLFLAMIYLALGPIAATPQSNPTRLFSGAMIANVGGLLIGTALGLLDSAWTSFMVTAIVLAVICVILLVGIALYSNRSYSVFRINYYNEDEYSFECIAAPAAGVPSFENGAQGSDGVLQAITERCVSIGQRYDLSRRERDVLSELVRGRTIATIASELGVSENTAKAHTKAIYRKLDVHTREELLARVEQG